ncbi:FAM203 family protein GA19338 [Clonorchis sinensis]|uniref:Protein HGH1 homolog n=1 Tax=Clonorchis sinensis TaxID=79923 RepID=H2KUQ1_CLOSI|nr:FAM203 family protein GA19338 [Clonorchis sinensis]
MDLDTLRLLARVIAENPDAEAEDEYLLNQFDSFLQFLLNENRTSSPDQQEAFKLSLNCLTNLCWSCHRNELLRKAIGSDERCRTFVSLIKGMLFQNSHPALRPLVIGLLCNLTRDEVWASQFFQDDHERLISAVLPAKVIIDDTIPVMHISTVYLKLQLLLNMTSNRELRRRLCANGTFQTQLLTRFASESNPERAVLLAGIVKNCCFEDGRADLLSNFFMFASEYHPQLLGPRSQLLEVILRPLCGPEDSVDSEDKQALPVSLQQLIGNPSTVRSESNELKSTICHALLQLCATSWGRTRLRSVGTYFILRELHKYEGSKLSDGTLNDVELFSTRSLLYDIEQVVDQLICEERDRDRATTEKSLRDIEVDAEMAQKLERDRVDYIGVS